MSDVLVKQKDGSFRRGFVSDKRKSASYVWYVDNCYDEYPEWVGSEMIIILEKREVTKELAYDILLGNKSIEEVFGDEYYSFNMVDGIISLSVDDLIKTGEVLLKVKDKNRWLHFFGEVVDLFNLDFDFDDLESLDRYMIINNINDYVLGYESESFCTYLKEFETRKDLPLKDRYISKDDKYTILLKAFQREGNYSFEVNEACYSFMLDEDFINDSKVTYIKAYSYYGGNSFCPCDYKKAVENLEKLLEDGDPFAANSLGYIYYYGRVNDGVPQYDLAYKYFSMAAAVDDEPEAICKLSDMFKNGYFVEKKYHVAYKLLDKIHDLQRKLLERNMPNKYADVALRLGSMHENGYHVDKSDEMALKYYSIAKAAIVLRRNIYANFGDRSVERGIDKSLERLNYASSKISKVKNIQNILYQFGEYEAHTAKIKENKAGETIITLFKPSGIFKLVVDFNKKKYYFTDKISLIIKTKNKIIPKCLEEVQIHYVDNEELLVEYGDDYYGFDFKDIKIKLYNEVK